MNTRDITVNKRRKPINERVDLLNPKSLKVSVECVPGILSCHSSIVWCTAVAGHSPSLAPVSAAESPLRDRYGARRSPVNNLQSQQRLVLYSPSVLFLVKSASETNAVC
ncbi:hypothetical protein J6590_052443 [Homalodisca vitripennis]|nr:hypothetical protein J6590_052443 [Homalodisca vitripennis]